MAPPLPSAAPSREGRLSGTRAREKGRRSVRSGAANGTEAAHATTWASEHRQRRIRASDTLGRYGGDEFAIVLEDAALPGDAILVARRIVAALAVPFMLDGHHVRTTASIGIAVYPREGEDAMTLIKNADVAMYAAKRGGRNRFEFFADASEPLAAVG